MAMDFVTCLSCFQNTLAANAELANALNEKNRDWRKLKRAVELKDGRLPALKRLARKMKVNILCLLLIRPATNFFAIPTTQT